MERLEYQVHLTTVGGVAIGIQSWLLECHSFSNLRSSAHKLSEAPWRERSIVGNGAEAQNGVASNR